MLISICHYIAVVIILSTMQRCCGGCALFESYLEWSSVMFVVFI